jgi:hypothetical protein
MVVSSVTYLIEWKTAAMPIIWLQRSGVAWPKKHVAMLRDPPHANSPSQKKSSTGHALLPRICV